ncbi:N-acyl homoserine lactonase family protein [Pseudogemmobacter bohemicus]|uniref:N-acyl homoserine lactonase family protein n=1 Tax=Pseudogemmobacter bohemicus TaxID=2250708 RepID=UPI000DD3DCC5|nr:N-acyl homoserine lactonase family protein [Pseudogemmobacter bohemicus]
MREERDHPADAAVFELFALRYAEHSGRHQGENFVDPADPHEAGSNLDYFIWLARRGAETLVIDTGFGPDAARRRGRRLFRTAREALALVGVDSHQVETVILTHLHYDHAGSLTDFPRAQFHLQEAEAAHATGPCMCDPAARGVFDVENIVEYIRSLYAGRITFHQGDHDLGNGIRLHEIPGHSAGLQAVSVPTARGRVLLASDATHLYANLARHAPFPILWDEARLRQGFARLEALAPSADHIIPGHDPLVMQAYPAVSEPLSGIAVRLDTAPLLSFAELSR